MLISNSRALVGRRLLESDCNWKDEANTATRKCKQDVDVVKP